MYAAWNQFNIGPLAQANGDEYCVMLYYVLDFDFMPRPRRLQRHKYKQIHLTLTCLSCLPYFVLPF